MKGNKPLHFDVSTGLKRVLGRELITDDEVAIFELVKNSFDAKASAVRVFFSDESIIVADNGTGMSYDDLINKWLFVAYSAKRQPENRDFRNRVAERGHYAGSKGVGRFSSDRLGRLIVLQTRPNAKGTKAVHRLEIDWDKFEQNDKEHFEKVPVGYEEATKFQLPEALKAFGDKLSHGTVIEIRNLRQSWNRPRLIDLKASLAKLINPFGEMHDGFSIELVAPAEKAGDAEVRANAKKANEDPVARELVNGPVGNFIFSELQGKTTLIKVEVDGDSLVTQLTDRGEEVYRIREPNPYNLLKDAGLRCEVYYLNRSAKVTFARRIGLPSVQFGSVFLFRNGFRVYPVGEDGDDWFGFNRRKQQGFSRYLGSREIIGRVDVFGDDEDFQEASSRNQALIETPAVKQLRKAVMDHVIKRLEKYVVPVSWVDPGEADADDLSRLLNDPGKARVSAAVASLVDNDEIELLSYSKRLVGLLNERSSEFETSLVSLRAIAEKTSDKRLLKNLDRAERRFEELKQSEAEARSVADREKATAEAAVARAETAEALAEKAQLEADTERRRSHFLEAAVNLDAATILNLHHQVTIYAVDISQQIENLLSDTADQKMVPRETILSAMEQMAFLNKKILAIARFASKATFKLDSEMINADLPTFVADYISQVARAAGSARTKLEVTNKHPGLRMLFNPIDIAVIVDNLISNARRAKASKVTFTLDALDKGALAMEIADNGRGLAPGADHSRIFEMGYSTTQGSGLGLYHVRQVLGEMGGSIELINSETGRGTTFQVRIVPKGRGK